MNQNDYIAELRKRLSINENDLFVKENNSVMLILKNGCYEMKYGFACSWQTDFSEENLKNNAEIFECIQKHISKLDMKLSTLKTQMSIDELD